jgi:hypothetical protein
MNESPNASTKEIQEGLAFSDIPYDLRSLFETDVLTNFQAYGFGDESEARRFLIGASVGAYKRDLALIMPFERDNGKKSLLSIPFGSSLGH